MGYSWINQSHAVSVEDLVYVQKNKDMLEQITDVAAKKSFHLPWGARDSFDRVNEIVLISERVACSIKPNTVYRINCLNNFGGYKTIDGLYIWMRYDSLHEAHRMVKVTPLEACEILNEH